MSKPRATTSTIWNYFVKSDREYKKAICKCCKKALSYKSTTSNLRLHLRKKHVGVHEQYCRQERRRTSISLNDDEVSCTCGLDDEDGTHKEGCPGGPRRPSLEFSSSFVGSAGAKKAATPSSRDYWDYYVKLELETAQCRLCDAVVSWGSDAETLLAHLATEHPAVKIENKDAAANSDEDDALQSAHEVLISETYNQSDDDILETPPKKSKKRKHNYSSKWDTSSDDDDDALNPPHKNSIRRREEKSMFSKRRTSDEDWGKSLDRFGLYIASIMKMLPRETASKFQVQIVDRLMQEKMKFD